jgi:hypothetical protein
MAQPQVGRNVIARGQFGQSIYGTAPNLGILIFNAQQQRLAAVLITFSCHMP